jgi:hypothetical protein
MGATLRKDDTAPSFWERSYMRLTASSIAAFEPLANLF